MARVMVTGMGLVSALGIGLEANQSALDTGRSGLGPSLQLDSRYASELTFGEVVEDSEMLRSRTGIGEEAVSRTSLLAILACDEAIKIAGLTKIEIAARETALISASTVGGMRKTQQLYNDTHSTESRSSHAGTYSISAHTHRLARHFGFRGLTDTFNTACSSSANAIMFGARLIRSGRARRAIVGGSDALAKFTVNGFNALMILSEEPCRPFDQNRKGLNLGEGAAYLVLEREDLCDNKEPLAEIRGFGNACDAYHASATSDEAWGPTLAMGTALEDSGLSPQEIDYINAHGTGTEINDRTEWAAIRKVFGTPPSCSATKSYTGHTLGAAGSLEAAFTLLSMQNDLLYPNLNCNDPIDTYVPIPGTTPKKIRHAMSNSFGFGGNCTSLVFSHV